MIRHVRPFTCMAPAWAVLATVLTLVASHVEAQTSAARRDTSSLTVSAAIAAAEAQSPRVASADAGVTAATAVRQAAGTRPNPTVDLSTENWGARTSLPSDSFALVSQPVELGGKPGLRVRAAGADLRAAEAGLAQTRLTAQRQVVDAYMRLVRAAGWLTVLESHRSDFAELVQVMRRRTEEGLAAESEWRKLETELARLDNQLVRARIDVRQGEYGLATLTGWPAAGLGGRVAEPGPLPALPATSVDAAVRQRPDVRAAQARVDAASLRLSFERVRPVPDARVTGGLKRTSNLNTGVISVSLTVPLWDRNRAGIARATGDLRAATLDVELLTREATAEAASWADASRLLEGRLAEVQADLLAPAAIVRTAARAAFREGGGDTLRLIDADRVHADALRDALDLRIDAWLAAAQARLALGEDLP